MEHRKTLPLKIPFAVFSLLLFLVACNKEDAPDFIKTTGASKTESRNPGDFHYVFVDDRTHLRLLPDPANRVEVSAGKNLLPQILTTVRNDTLFIENKNRFNFLRNFRDSIIVTLHSDHLQGMEYRGAGSVVSLGKMTVPKFSLHCSNGSGTLSLDMNSDSLFFYFNAGPADLTLSGNTHYLYLFGAGQGFLRASACKATNAQADCRSSGDFYVNAQSELLVDIAAAGNVYYYGNPSLTVKNRGKGKLIALQ